MGVFFAGCSTDMPPEDREFEMLVSGSAEDVQSASEATVIGLHARLLRALRDGDTDHLRHSADPEFIWLVAGRADSAGDVAMLSTYRLVDLLARSYPDSVVAELGQMTARSHAGGRVRVLSRGSRSSTETLWRRTNSRWRVVQVRTAIH